VPRAKYTKPPEFPAIENIPRAAFRFRHDQWRQLSNLLPPKFAALSVPPDAATTWPNKVKTIADWVVQATEDAINSHLTTSPLISERPMNPANVRAAIRKLREAVRTFAHGWVDSETADLVPPDLDSKLAARDQEVANLRLPPAQRRALEMLCQHIAVYVRKVASANDEEVSKQEMLRYIDAALNLARIK